MSKGCWLLLNHWLNSNCCQSTVTYTNEQKGPSVTLLPVLLGMLKAMKAKLTKICVVLLASILLRIPSSSSIQWNPAALPGYSLGEVSAGGQYSQSAEQLLQSSPALLVTNVLKYLIYLSISWELYKQCSSVTTLKDEGGHISSRAWKTPPLTFESPTQLSAKSRSISAPVSNKFMSKITQAMCRAGTFLGLCWNSTDNSFPWAWDFGPSLCVPAKMEATSLLHTALIEDVVELLFFFFFKWIEHWKLKASSKSNVLFF